MQPMSCSDCKRPLDPEAPNLVLKLLDMAFCPICAMTPYVTRLLAGQSEPTADLW